MGATDPGGGARDRGVGKPEGSGAGPSGLRPGGQGLSIVKVRFEPSGKVAEVAPGAALLAAAHWARVPVASSCGGVGSRGECRVRLPSGGGPEGADGEFLSQQEVDEGWRLTQAYPGFLPTHHSSPHPSASSPLPQQPQEFVGPFFFLTLRM